MVDNPVLQGISRRKFLVFAGMTVAGGVLSACVAAPAAAAPAGSTAETTAAGSSALCRQRTQYFCRPTSNRKCQGFMGSAL